MNDDLTISHEDFERLVQQTRDSQKRKYLEGLRTPITVKCVVCDVEIPDSFLDEGEVPQDELAEEYAKHSSFANGAVGVLAFGYGCKHDTKVFIIGICEHCYDNKVKTGGVLFTRSYMP